MKTLLLASAFALTAGAAFAQDAAPAAPKSAQPPAAEASASANATVSDAEVAKVAALAADVKTINAQHQPKIASAADAAAKAEAQKGLDTAINDSLTKHGLTVERYNEIASLAQSDKALAAKIAAAGSASTGSATSSSTNEPAR